MTDFASFLRWEASSRDSIDFKKIYVDIAGDLNAGLMLSELLYWYLPSHGTEENKLRVERDGFQWIAVPRYQWWDRARLSPEQSDRALKILCDKGLVFKKRYKFAGEVTVHIRMLETAFLEAWERVLNNPILNPFMPKTEMDLGKTPKSKLAKSANGNKDKAEILLTKGTAKNTPKDISPRKRDDMFDAISKVWGITAGGWVGNMKSMFLGTAKKGQWKQCNFEPPITDANELLNFEPYMLRRMAEKRITDKPTACVTIQRWFYDYRLEVAKKITRLDTPTDLSKWTSPDPFAFLESEGA